MENNKYIDGDFIENVVYFKHTLNKYQVSEIYKRSKLNLFQKFKIWLKKQLNNLINEKV